MVGRAARAALGALILCGAAHAGEFRADGEALLGIRGYPDSRVFGNAVEWNLAARADLVWRSGRTWTAKLTPRVFWDPADPARGRWIPFEGWAEFRTGSWRFRAGRQVFSWGVADTYNPADVLATRDYAADFLDPERLGDWSVAVIHGSARWGLEAVMIPWVEGALFPSARSPWSLDAAAERAFEDGQVLIPVEVVLNDTPYLPSDTRELSVAGRVRGTFGAVDVYGFGHTGTERSPVLITESNRLPVPFRAAYLPLHLLGAEAQAALGDWVLKASWAWRDQKTSDPLLNEQVFGPQGLEVQSTQGVAGAEWFRSEFAGGRGDLDVTLEYLWDTGAKETNLATYRPFRSTIALAARYLFNDWADTAMEAAWLDALASHEGLLTLRASRRVVPRVRAEIFADLLYGPEAPPSPFYFFEPNERLGILLRIGL